MSEQGDPGTGRRKDYSVGIGLSFGFAATMFWLGPLYTQVEGLGRWVFYAVALLLTFAAGIGLGLELIESFSESDRAKMWTYAAVLLIPAWLCHLATTLLFEDGGLFVALRTVAVVLLSLAGFLIAFIVLDVIENAPRPTNKTEAALAILSFVAVLVPIVSSLLGLD